MAIRLISCVGAAYDRVLLPHFLSHYRDLGVSADRMHILVNAATADDPCLAECLEILRTEGIRDVEPWIAPYTSDDMWQKRRDVQKRATEDGDWVISADVDEFHRYPAPLAEFLRECDRRGADCVQGPFIDRVAAGGVPKAPAAQPALPEQFPVETDVICAIRSRGGQPDYFGTVKLMAMRAHLLPSRGGHHPVGQGPKPNYLFGGPLGNFPGIGRARVRFCFPVRVDHYKWTESVAPSTINRARTPGASKAGSEYGRQLLEQVERRGHFDLRQPRRNWFNGMTLAPWKLRLDILTRMNRAASTLKRLSA